MLSVYAQTDGVAEFANKVFEHFINPVIALLVFVGFILLIYLVFRFVKASSDGSGDRQVSFKGLAMAVFGIFVMVSIWTIFNFVSNVATTKVDDTERSRFREGEIDFLLP